MGLAPEPLARWHKQRQTATAAQVPVQGAASAGTSAPALDPCPIRSCKGPFSCRSCTAACGAGAGGARCVPRALCWELLILQSSGKEETASSLVVAERDRLTQACPPPRAAGNNLLHSPWIPPGEAGWAAGKV